MKALDEQGTRANLDLGSHIETFSRFHISSMGQWDSYIATCKTYSHRLSISSEHS